MEVLIVVLLVLVLVLLVVVAVRPTRTSDPQALDAALQGAVRTVAELAAQQSSEALGNRAEVLTTAMKGVQDDVSRRLAEVNAELAQLRERSAAQFSSVNDAVTALAQRTQNLNEVLSSSQKRGQWGERLAEDMLRAVGFVENVNYAKQVHLGGGRPDYALKMPPDRVLYMDVKFPLDSYAAHLAAEDDVARAATKGAFVQALRTHVKALAKREYVDKAQGDALDYVLLFVPNESISGFVHEADGQLIDWALEQKVVLCSPLTLYAFLVVVRQATDTFHTEQAAASIMQQVNKFSKEFGNYVKAVDEVKKGYDKLGEQLEVIATDGTRFRKLHVPVREIERLRTREGVPELDTVDDDELPSPN